jgi:inosine/xanthosine triphosphate pyrophosphatase family protein
MNDIRYQDVQAPPDATSVGNWELYDVDGFARGFRGTVRGHVALVGGQRANGAVFDRSIVIDDLRIPAEMTAAEARELAHRLSATADDLMAAADEWEGNRNGYTLMSRVEEQ